MRVDWAAWQRRFWSAINYHHDRSNQGHKDPQQFSVSAAVE